MSGQPEISLLLQRIHLPLDEKKHMPPSGKAQLSAQEIALLAWLVAQAAAGRTLAALTAAEEAT